MTSQVHLFYQEQKNIADGNQQFLELVADGLTREDLDACIKRRPSLWSRFAKYREHLPSAKSAPDAPCTAAVTTTTHNDEVFHELAH